MFTRTMALLCAGLAAGFDISYAQSPQSKAADSTSETTRQAETDARIDISKQLGWELAAGTDGVRIERISKNSLIAEAHLEENDIIKSVAGENVLTPERVTEVLTRVAEAGETKTDIVIVRDGRELSYLLSLESLSPAGRSTSATTVHVTQADLVQMIQQLQAESQQQQSLLQALLMEVQSLRAQLAGGIPTARAGSVVPGGATVLPGGTQFTGDIVAPLGTSAAPAAVGGAVAEPSNRQATPAAKR